MAIARQSSARNVGRFWHVFLIASQHRAPQNNPIIWDLANSVAIRFFQRNQDIFEYDYLFTLKNAHLSSSSYNFWMQQNIAIKFARYVARILLCKHCNFGGKIYYAAREIEFFLGDYYFLARPVHCSSIVPCYHLCRILITARCHAGPCYGSCPLQLKNNVCLYI